MQYRLSKRFNKTLVTKIVNNPITFSTIKKNKLKKFNLQLTKWDLKTVWEILRILTKVSKPKKMWIEVA